VIEAAQIGVLRSDRLTARKSSPGNFGLLQHNRHIWDIHRCPLYGRFRGQCGQSASDCRTIAIYEYTP